ncbi:glycosyltransferase, group 1 family protein [Leptospira broomii serovar Hurstbridge str. 5399]|uniref:Glycosyltransferase, group 1 family protein n=2 Tax=Leptospira broomii TaxID=301541 RepID=T0GGT4_9LEPT|nr:glycosyltransferase, group 1 family protein [Leptospira broomii serovar Hurstbridge str. 5399]
MKSPILKIGYDARMISHSGIGMRIQGILSELAPIAKKKRIQITLLGSADRLRSAGISSDLLESYGFLPYDAEIYSIREWWGISEMADFDLLDIPHFNAPLRFLEKCIVTVHDIIPFKMKQFHPSIIKQLYLRLVFSLLRESAQSIITVSDFTAKDLTEVFGFSSDSMKTVYNGIDPKLFYPKSANEIRSFRKRYGLEPGYFLSVGIGKEHKNLAFVLQVLKGLWSLGKLDTQWVIAGANGQLPEYLRKDAAGWEEKIVVLPHLPLEELGTLYSASGLLIFPSLYEGFGFPPVEAQASGCPVFSSNASAMPEILGSSAFYFSPTDRDGFETGLLELVKNPKLAVSKKLSGKKNAEKYNWKSAAGQTVDEYLRIAVKRGILRSV